MKQQQQPTKLKRAYFQTFEVVSKFMLDMPIGHWPIARPTKTGWVVLWH